MGKFTLPVSRTQSKGGALVFHCEGFVSRVGLLTILSGHTKFPSMRRPLLVLTARRLVFFGILRFS
jgi:hypothetical protein